MVCEEPESKFFEGFLKRHSTVSLIHANLLHSFLFPPKILGVVKRRDDEFVESRNFIEPLYRPFHALIGRKRANQDGRHFHDLALAHFPRLPAPINSPIQRQCAIILIRLSLHIGSTFHANHRDTMLPFRLSPPLLTLKHCPRVIRPMLIHPGTPRPILAKPCGVSHAKCTFPVLRSIEHQPASRPSIRIALTLRQPSPMTSPMNISKFDQTETRKTPTQH
mmetsp:Transcript_12479/g.25377  ORF Transcript_12479/g.25377 Transcript_12479/m.25377 type:complete len:221 (+) Transcript_12479:441-1103(+)